MISRKDSAQTENRRLVAKKNIMCNLHFLRIITILFRLITAKGWYIFINWFSSCDYISALLKKHCWISLTLWSYILDDLRVFQPDRPSSLNPLDVGCFYYLYQSDWMTSESMLYNSAQALHVMALRTPFNEPFLTHNIHLTASKKY